MNCHGDYYLAERSIFQPEETLVGFVMRDIILHISKICRTGLDNTLYKSTPAFSISQEQDCVLLDLLLTTNNMSNGLAGSPARSGL